MKLVSHVIYTHLVTFFMELKTKCIIRFLSARNKLKNFKGPPIECHLKTPYAQRKWLSIKYTKWYLENSFCDEERCKWLPIFENSKSKADDSGDSALMCISELR